MGKLNDLSGTRFGRLEVVEISHRNKTGHIMWKCICNCGNVTIVDGRDLRRKKTQSCGCFLAESARQRSKVDKVKHGKCHTRLYSIYTGIKDRCYNPNNQNYFRYGGRGIKMCDRWLDDFETFHEWSITHGYNERLSIDRVDVNGDYEPLNCRWSTMKEQSLNKRNSIYIEFNGVKKHLCEWAEQLNLDSKLIRARLSKGWDLERALYEAPYVGKNQHHKGNKSS